MAKNTEVENALNSHTADNVPAIPADTGDGWEHASSVIWRPQEGEALEGVYSGSAPFTEGTLSTEVSKHFVKNSEGYRYSFVGGSVFDKNIKEAGIIAGYIVRITYLGQQDCTAGRVNLFDIKYKKS